jgi:hypothetical protein
MAVQRIGGVDAHPAVHLDGDRLEPNSPFGGFGQSGSAARAAGPR